VTAAQPPGSQPAVLAGAGSRAALRLAADRVLLTDAAGEVRTGRSLGDRTEALGRGLTALGLSGRRVGLWYWNSVAAIEAHLAVEWIGATKVPVDPGAPTAEARAVFEAAAVDAVLTDAAHQALPGAHLHDTHQPLATPGPARTPGALEEIRVPADRTAVLYPRMTTAAGLFAVPISYRNWEAGIRNNVTLYRSGTYGPGFDSDEVFVTAQQLPHGTGLIGTFPFLHMGLPQVLLQRFDADAFTDAVHRHKATASFFVPGMVTRLADTLHRSGRTVVPPLRRLLYGGAPIAAEEITQAHDRIGPVLVQLYGRFEGGWPLSVLSIEDHRRIAQGDADLARSCGRPVAGTNLRIRPVPGQPPDHGELCVRGDTVVPGHADPDGWYALGDICWLDDDGYLFLGGRLDGMINTGSYHVYPGEVEEAITAAPGVKATLVRGEPDPTWGQAVTAYVVPADPDAATTLPTTLRPLLEQRLARYKLPKRIHLIPSLDAIPPHPDPRPPPG
jgi:fatty-acyl-CoA synthase